MSSAARLSAAVIAATALLALAAQTMAASTLPGLGTPLALVWRLGAYFTILTNLIALGFFASVAAGAVPKAFWSAAVMLWLVLVGIVYHTLLAGLRDLAGLDWWANLGLHTVVPLGALVWWTAFAPKHGLSARQLPGWLAWPVLYLAYALARGLITGFWPYPFLDVAARGPASVAMSLAVMLVLFSALCLAMVAVARIIR